MSLFELCFWSDIKNYKFVLLLKAQCFLHINTAYPLLCKELPLNFPILFSRSLRRLSGSTTYM